MEEDEQGKGLGAVLCVESERPGSCSINDHMQNAVSEELNRKGIGLFEMQGKRREV